MMTTRPVNRVWLGIKQGLVCWLGMVSLSLAEEGKVVDQRSLPGSDKGCAIASWLNCLKFSEHSEFPEIYRSLLGNRDVDKMTYLLDRYLRSRKSVVFDGVSRWQGQGVMPEDLLVSFNEMLADRELASLSGTYLDRLEDEGDVEFVQRIHQHMKVSLDRGVAPILSLRTFFVREDEKSGRMAWNMGPHHFFAVAGVGEIEGEVGFLIDALDPWKGRSVSIYLYRSEFQPFHALKGEPQSGEWLSGHPFLLAIAPESKSLKPKKLEWDERFVIISNYLIGDFHWLSER